MQKMEGSIFTKYICRPLAMKLLDVVSKMSLESSPIFFHCFSNSGVTVYQYMAEEMGSNKQYEGMMDKVIGEISILKHYFLTSITFDIKNGMLLILVICWFLTKGTNRILGPKPLKTNR